MVWDASVVEVKSLVGGDTEQFCFSSRVIDGLETLDELEKLPVNEKTYRPLNDVHIKDITIHANPFALWPPTVVTRSLEAGQTDCWMAVFGAPSDRVTGAGPYLGVGALAAVMLMNCYRGALCSTSPCFQGVWWLLLTWFWLLSVAFYTCKNKTFKYRYIFFATLSFLSSFLVVRCWSNGRCRLPAF